MPPPKALPPLATPWATLALSTTFDNVRLPALRMPAPSVARPAVIVRPARVTVVPELMAKTRLAALPLTASWLAPGPSIRRSSVMLSWPPVSGMVPLTPGAKSMLSGPAFELASRTASRSESSPSPLSTTSSVVVRSNVAGTVRSSSVSSRGRQRAARRPLPAVLPECRESRRFRSQDVSLMVEPPAGLRYHDGAIAPGAQTERRGEAGPVRTLLGVRGSPAPLLSARAMISFSPLEGSVVQGQVAQVFAPARFHLHLAHLSQQAAC